MIPKNEITWERLRYTKTEYIITSTPSRDTYFIYEVKGSGAKRLGKGENPKVLEEKFVR